MIAALDQSSRTALERFVQKARRLIEADLEREAEGRFGIHPSDGTVEEEAGLHLDPTSLAARRDVVEILDFLVREEGDGQEAAARLIREAAFTHLNRLVAIRIAEEIELLPESLAKGPTSQGYKDVLEVAPLLSHDASGGYWRYLQMCGDELAADLPQLFDPRNPLHDLAPSPAALDELIDMIRAAELDAVWAAPDALGWVYQFFNSGDERREMREVSVSPRNSRELAVRNQFFTPRYVVDFLVQNSLGRRLMETDPSSPLLDDLPLLLDPPREPREPLELTNVRVLDPACGSGHFLLGAYDVLERAWHHQGVTPVEAAPHIVASLWGVDIDPRCAQVASAAVILRARRHCKSGELAAPNVITARALPEPAEGWDSLLSELPEDHRRLVASIRDALEAAPILGPLLKVEERLAMEIRATVAGAADDSSTLFGAAGIADDNFGRAEAAVLEALQGIADSATSGPVDRLFAAEAQDAIRFVEAMRHRYDAVLMNPPFGEPVEASKSYLKATYPWLPWKDYNLFALFTGRGIELCSPTGYLGAITSRVGLFLKTYQNWREQILLGNSLSSLIDLGLGVMEQAMVEAAAYTIQPGTSRGNATFVRLLREPDRVGALHLALRSIRSGVDDDRVFSVNTSDFKAVEGSPVSYWLNDSIRRLFRELPRVEGSAAEVRQGTATGDDFRFVRCIWEVKPSEVAYTREQTTQGGRWVPFAKGGGYSPYWADVHLVLDWASDGAEIRSFSGARAQNTQYFFRPGLTWPTRTASGFAPRVLPSGCAFANKGNGVFPIEGADPLVILAWLNSRAARAALDSMLAAADSATAAGAAKSYEVGLVQKLPWLAGSRDDLKYLRSRCVEIVQRHRHADLFDENSGLFVHPHLPGANETLTASVHRVRQELDVLILEMLEASLALDERINLLLGLDVDGLQYLDQEIGNHPLTYPTRDDIDERISDLLAKPMESVVNELIAERGGSASVAKFTFIADHRVEVIAHGLEVNPRDVLRVRHERQLLQPGEARAAAADVFSYLVGIATGRWTPSLNPVVDSVEAGDLFECRLAESLAGTRSNQAHVDVAETVCLTLVDEVGHDRDIAIAVEDAAAELFGSADKLQEVLDLLGGKDIRNHLRGRFFRDHLSRYSRSRRKAPIYWPLYVPSGKWGVWVYAPTFTRETLYAIAAEALRREGHSLAEVARLERERAAGDSGVTAKALDKALDDERKLGEELRRFRAEAERIAGLGWEPDLDDGIVLCAAPLADLFPAWKELAKYRDELRAGKYEWATVARWADQL